MEGGNGYPPEVGGNNIGTVGCSKLVGLVLTGTHTGDDAQDV